ncbi:MAG: organic solvent tolerance protein OstA [Spirochaetales bacterium]|nr:organic solvent tolerance protein OstA [Spirochaetales bacterium]
MRNNWLASGFILFLILTTGLFAEEISFSGDSMKTLLSKGKERTVLTGNAQFQSEDSFIKADKIELYGKDFKYLRCEGGIRLVNNKEEIEVSSEKVFYNRKEKFLRVQGNAVMEDKKNEVIVKGGIIENWEEKKLAIIQTGVRILKKDMVCRAEFARYLRDDERLELSGLPVVIWKGDEYKAIKIYVNLKTDEILLEGNVKGEVLWEDEEDEQKKKDEQ